MPKNCREMMRCMAVATLLSSTLLGVCSGADDGPTPHRSIRQPQLHPHDNRDWPRYRRRKSQLGWEYYSRHFVVTSTTGPDQAEWIAHDLEATWKRLGRLADFWTDAHHQPTFCISAVSVMVTDNWQQANGPTPGGPRTLNDDPGIYVSLAPGRPDLAGQLPQIRREAVRSFMRVTQLDQVLPDWVQTGLAEFVAEEEADDVPDQPQPIAATAVPKMKVQEFRANSADAAEQASAENSASDTAGTVQNSTFATSNGRVGERSIPSETSLPVFLASPPQRTSENTVPAVPTDPIESSAWVRFLLTGYDGRYSPVLLRALGETAAARGHDRERWAIVSQGVWRPPIDPRLFRENWQPSELLISRQLVAPGELDEEWSRWQADPLVGQPILAAENLTSQEALDAVGQMIVVLKLADRYGGSGDIVAPRITTFEPGDAAGKSPQEGPATAVRPINLAALNSRLTADTTQPWATIDAEGQLLFWSDRERVTALFDDAQRQCRSFVRDGHIVLQRNIAGGRSLEVWLEENPDDPLRPLARAVATP